MTYLGAQEDDGCLQLMASYRQLASGVHAPHRVIMLQRDLKPSNVLVADEPVIAVYFGLVRAIVAESAAITADDAVVGTPAYMPEQILGGELCQQVSSLSEATLGKYALGRMLAYAAGEAMCRKAEQTLRDPGFVAPSSVLPLHFPELV